MNGPWDTRFERICPPSLDTYSHHERPCHIDHVHGAECSYAAYCEKEGKRRANLQQVLEAAYTSPVHVTLVEPSSSIVVRSEHLFHGKEGYRLSLRKHFYEHWRSSKVNAHSTERTFCPLLGKDDWLGQYLGFIDLRLHYAASPLALGLLAVPRRLRDDPDAHIIAGDYSPLFGGPPFTCNAYSMQDDETGGAACAQACMIMVLCMLADRGAVVEGSYGLTHRAHLDYASDDDPNEVKALRKDSGVARVFKAFGGLTPTRIVNALNLCNVNACLVRVPSEPVPDFHPLIESGRAAPYERLAQRIIEAYVQVGCPVILGVQGKNWWKKHNVESPCGHAVAVVGIRKCSLHERAATLVVHDPAEQPFRERPVRECFRAAWNFNPKDPAIRMIVATERAVARQLWSCLKYLMSGHDPESTSAFSDLVFHSVAPDSKLDYRCALVFSKDIHSLLSPNRLGPDEREKLLKLLNLASQRYWCIVGYLNRQVDRAWLFAADAAADGQYDVGLRRHGDGQYSLFTPDRLQPDRFRL